MVENLSLDNGFRLSIKSVETGLDLEAIHTAVHALRDTIASLIGLEHTTFSFFYNSPPRNLPLISSPDGKDEDIVCLGLQFEAPLDKFTLVLRCLGNWLDHTGQRTQFVVHLPPAHTLHLQTKQSKVLAQLLPLGAALMHPQEVYFAKAQTYINTLGDFTPAARANLAFVRRQVGLSREDANELNAELMGPI
jgi:hypothetical protein